MRFVLYIGSHNLKSFFSPSKLVAMKNNLKFLVWVILLAFLSCKKDDGLTVVEGRLFDSSTNKGIKGVEVGWVESDLSKTKWKGESKILTDADGHYRLQFIASSNSFYRISVHRVIGSNPFFELQSGNSVDIKTNKKQTINFPACICSNIYIALSPTQGLQTDSLQVFNIRYKPCDKQLQPFSYTIPSVLLKQITTSTDWLFDVNVASNLPFQSQIKRYRNGQVVSDTTIIRIPSINKLDSIKILF